jgi:hypothetical protein
MNASNRALSGKVSKMNLESVSEADEIKSKEDSKEREKLWIKENLSL